MPLFASVSCREPTGTCSARKTVPVPGRGLTHTRRPLGSAERWSANMPSSRSCGAGLKRWVRNRKREGFFILGQRMKRMKG
ncbi:MAG: hypothetical protein HW418_2053 [Anaerolineales bacterium]|nr:hypothetical protein [Anaerolineales bacterium]